MVNGKQKGSAYERHVCVKLSQWVSAGKSDDLFWRSAMSGGRATVSAKRGKLLNNQAGDICAVGVEGHTLTSKYYIECKFYKDLNIDRFFLAGTGALSTFWRETIKQASIHNKIPILIARQNRYPDLLITKSGEFTHLLHGAHCSLSSMCIVRHKNFSAEVRLFLDVVASPFNNVSVKQQSHVNKI